jgi:hypothetical protein
VNVRSVDQSALKQEWSWMRLESARELKKDLVRSVIEPMATSIVTKSTLGVPAGPMSELSLYSPMMALGISRKSRVEYILALRLQRHALRGSPQVEAIRKQAKGEVDIQYIGLVNKLAGKPWQEERNRPLRIGGSVGHFRTTAGSLGCFVRREVTGPVMILSNNHALADENRGKKGQDAILQPGCIDGGRHPEHQIAMLTDFVRLYRAKPNFADCALGTVDEGISVDFAHVDGLGRLAGVAEAEPDVGEIVGKVGRTTGTTRGRIAAIDVDYVMIGGYHEGRWILRFDGLIEIVGEGSNRFSAAGDSGSLVVDSTVKAIGLLLAGSAQGGSNGLGVSYANPLSRVLSLLRVSLATE